MIQYNRMHIKNQADNRLSILKFANSTYVTYLESVAKNINSNFSSQR